MRIPSGVTDQVIYFVAVDSTDLKTRETGLTTFTVYRSRDGGTAAAFTTPTVTEIDATNMPGLYKLLLDEDMTITAGNVSEEYAVHITQASMAPVTRTFELYLPAGDQAVAEPSAVPTWPATVEESLGWLLALARNKGTQTATTADIPVRSGSEIIVRKRSGDVTVAHISAAGTTLNIATGEGGV